MLVFSGNIYFWRRYRVNYPFIFGLKEGTELGYRQVLLLSAALSVVSLAAVISNLDMDMDRKTNHFETLPELVPLGLVIVSSRNSIQRQIFVMFLDAISFVLQVLLLILFCPLNIIYRSSRFFLIRCTFRCFFAPLYKVMGLKFSHILIILLLRHH